MASCAPGHRFPAVGKAVAAAPAAHLKPLGDGTLYCKITGEVVSAHDAAAHQTHGSHLTADSHVEHAEHTVHDTHAPAAGGHGAHESGTGHGPEHMSLRDQHRHESHECRPTETERAAATKLVADTRAAIEKYSEVANAALAGYGPSAGGAQRIWHYLNSPYQRDEDVLYPDHIESLVYGVTDRHGLVLIGGLYIMPRAGMHGPEVGGCLTRWHIHDLGDGSHELPEMLHVWIVDMPGGPFAMDADPQYVRNL